MSAFVCKAFECPLSPHSWRVQRVGLSDLAVSVSASGERGEELGWNRQGWLARSKKDWR